MLVNKMGLNYTHNHNFRISRLDGSGDYLFILVKTPAIFELHGKKLRAEKNSMILYRKGTPQLYYAVEDSYANDFIHFDMETDWELRKIPMDTLLVVPSVRQISRILKDIYMEYISNNVNREDSIQLLMNYLFNKINEMLNLELQENKLYYHFDILLRIRSIIYNYPGEAWTVDRLSKQANLSSSYFQKLYKKTFGVTCISDVIESKMEYAKTSLTVTNCTVRQIASLCGYEHEEHFMRQFKHIVGMTPSEYRRKSLI